MNAGRGSAVVWGWGTDDVEAPKIKWGSGTIHASRSNIEHSIPTDIITTSITQHTQPSEENAIHSFSKFNIQDSLEMACTRPCLRLYGFPSQTIRSS